MNPIISALFIGPTFLVALLIFSNFNKVNIAANRWFGIFIVCVFLIQFNGLVYDHHFFVSYPHIYELLDLVNYIVAPVFFFGIVYFVEPNRKWRFTDNLHFLFGFLMLILTLLTFMVRVSSTPVKSQADKELESTVMVVFTIIFCAQVLPYCVVAFFKITRYQKNLFLYSSNTEKVNLGWLKKVVICVFFIAVLWLMDGLFQLSSTSPAFDSFSNVLYFVGICYIAYHSLKQREIFPYNKEEKEEIEIVIEETDITNTRKKLISDEKLAAEKQTLLALVTSEKPYLDYEISLIKLARQINTSPHMLSYIINTGFNENFFQFINRYRIEEAKRMILDPDLNHLTITGIAFEAGFNSKTVFNTTFKKMTGKTPTEFKKSSQLTG